MTRSRILPAIALVALATSSCALLSRATSDAPGDAAAAHQQLDNAGKAIGGAAGAILGGPAGGVTGTEIGHWGVEALLAGYVAWKRLTEAKRHAQYSSANKMS